LDGGNRLALLWEEQGFDPGQIIGLGAVCFAHIVAPERVVTDLKIAIKFND
jgi:hypothetical protein